MRHGAEFDFRWATPGDEPDIRALVGSVAMPGAVSVRFVREPDYFLGASIKGDPCDVLNARDRADGRLAAMGCRAEHPAFVNGRETKLGYIGQIRVADGYRGAWLVQRGARHFEAASASGLLYYGVIASDNPRARDLLTGRRLPGGVHVRRLCGITTCAILLRRTDSRPPRGLDVEPAHRAVSRGVSSGCRAIYAPLGVHAAVMQGMGIQGTGPLHLCAQALCGVTVIGA